MDVQPVDVPSGQWANGVWFTAIVLGFWGILYCFNRLLRRKDLRWTGAALLTTSIIVALLSFHFIRDIEGQKTQWKLNRVEGYRQFWDRFLKVPLGQFDAVGVTFGDGTEIAIREFQLPLHVVEASEVDNGHDSFRAIRGYSRSNPHEMIEFHFFPASGWQEPLPVAGEYVLCYFNTGGMLIQERYLLGTEYHILMSKPPER